MISTFKPYFDILPEVQRLLLDNLGMLSAEDFVLYGGTAVALRLGHRESVDFDFFTDQAFTTAWLYEHFPWLGRGTTLQEAPNTLTMLLPSGDSEVKVSFFGNMTFGRVGQPEWAEGSSVLVASLEDLLGLKLAVLLKRVEVKDYKDIAAILRAGLSLEHGLACARLFYPQFPPNEALKALVYFQEGDLSTLPLQDQETLVRAVQNVSTLPDVTLQDKALCSTN